MALIMPKRICMKFKQVLVLILGIVLVLSIAACGSQPAAFTENTAGQTEPVKETIVPSENASPTPEPTTDFFIQENTAEAAPAEEPAADHKDVLVVYFSATGTTRGVAEKIAAVTGADLYEIVPAEPYSSADLNYNDTSSRSTKEQNDKSARPAIESETLDLSGYTTIYLGFPIWWGEEPRILDTFVELYDFTGITLIPFCTSGGSGIGRSGPNMEALAGSGTWLDGRRFSRSVSEDELRSWIENLR